MLTVEQVMSDLEKEGYLIAYTHFKHDVEPPFLNLRTTTFMKAWKFFHLNSIVVKT